MVRRLIEQPSADASSSTFTMSNQAHTPKSDSDSSISRPFTPSSTSNDSPFASSSGTLNFDPDIPLPSIEREHGQPSSLGTHDSLTPRSRTPSFSLTLPPGAITPVPSSSTYMRSRTQNSTVHSLNERIGNLMLSGESTTRQASAQVDREAAYQPDSSISEANPPGILAPSSSEGSNRFSPRRGPGHSLHSWMTSSGERQPTRSSTASGIANGMENMTLGPEASQPNSPAPGTYLHPVSPSPARTDGEAIGRAQSASRRRSGSYFDQTPHDVADEEPPQKRFHESEFRRAFADAKSLVADLIDVLASSSLHNETGSSIRRLYLQANDLSRFQYPSTRTVGLVGDSGVGKSSMINSLLDFNRLARTSNSGAACTCVVTEYHYHESDDFTIETEYFNMDEVQDQFAELLQSYRQYHRHGDDVSADERKDLEEKAKVAQDTFRAAFRNHLIQDEKFLLDRPEEAVLQKLLTWTRESDLPLMEGAGSIPRREIVADAEQCSAHLMGLTSEAKSISEPSVWPFIRKIKVYLKAYILSKGLILVDLPGLRDLNSARLKITESYLLNCDEIFAVCYIGRATTDAGVKGVFDLAGRASLSSIGIICTKSDDIRADEAARDWDGEAAATTKKMVEVIAKDQQLIEMIESSIGEFGSDSDTDDERPDEESQELLRLHERLRKAKKHMNKHKFELKSYLINARNQSVMGALQETYQNRIPGGDLKVFCVSNTDYWEHRTKPKEEALPFLRLSRIFEVRKYCISIVAESQLRAATEYVTDVVPALLGSIKLWVQSGSGSVSAERKQSVRNTIDEVERALHALTLPASPINIIARSMQRQFNEELSQTMMPCTNQWSQAARDASLEWQTWHHSTYSAFCRNYGDYCTGAVERRCWNDEAMTAMVTHMATPWQNFYQNLQAFHDDKCGLIESTFDHAIALSDPAGIPTDSLRTLTATLRHRQYLLLSYVEQLCLDFQSDLLRLGTGVFSGIRSSIMGQLMEASYRACNLESGRGSDMRRKTIIRNGFGDNQLFESLRRQFGNRFSTLAQDLESKIQEALATHLAVVDNDLDILRNENVAMESESHPEFHKRVEREVERVGEEMVNIQTIIHSVGESAT